MKRMIGLQFGRKGAYPIHAKRLIRCYMGPTSMCR